MKCKVDGNVEIGLEQMKIEIDGIDFTLVPSKDGLLEEISAVLKEIQST